MDQLPQEIVDHIVSYLAPSNVRLKSPYDTKQKPSSSTNTSAAISASSSTTSLSTTLSTSSIEGTKTIAPLACISRQWQRAIERLTFRHIKLDSDELHIFGRTFTPARRHFLKSLTFDIVLPSYSGQASTLIETGFERHANDEAYTNGIHALFGILKSWEVEDSSLATYAHRRGLKLIINHPFSRSDVPYSLVSKWPWANNVPGGRASIHEGRYFHHHIALLDPQSLPQLHSVGKLVMKQPDGRWGFRMTYPKVPYVLAGKMPNLEAIDIDVNDNEKRFLELRRRNRIELAEAIENLHLPRLRKAEMLFFQMRYRDQRMSPPVLTGEDGVDALSVAVNKLSWGLRELSVTGVIDPSILRSGFGDEGINQKDTLRWSRLQRLEVNFYETTPSGGWYFTGRCPRDAPERFNLDQWADNGVETVERLSEEQFNFTREAGLAGMEPRNVFRTEPQSATVAPLVDAFAEATKLMPQLQTAMLNCTTDTVEGNFGEPEGHPEWFLLAYMEPSGSVVTNSQGLVERERPTGRSRSSSTQSARQLITSLMGWQPTKQLHKKLVGVESVSCRTEIVIEKDMDTWLREQSQLSASS